MLVSCVSAAPDPLLLEKAFPHVKFRRPVYITHAPGDARQLYVVEQHGVIWAVENDSGTRRKQIFLDISERVSRWGNEEGLLGLAFHPRYRENGYFFVHYSSKLEDGHGIVARFRRPAGSQAADPNSEVEILKLRQPYRNHNGGMIEFGHDGTLYISFGDGGAAGDPLNAGQDLSTWLGKILRIDVDCKENGRNYRIPPDNPFADNPLADRPFASTGQAIREEIWAYGLRNVWRFSFDRRTGQLWAGDVGQDHREEIDLITKGGNYGWNVFEGTRRYSRKSGRGPAIPPVFEYRHSGVWGAGSVTGGYVYRGEKIPELRGAYLYADYLSGEIWALTPKTRGGYQSRKLLDSQKTISSFGEDSDGELYLCAFDGYIYRFIAPHASEFGGRQDRAPSRH